MKINSVIKEIKVIDVNPNNIEKLYIGKPHSCMCGCSGKYYYSSKHVEYAEKHRGYPISKDEINDDKINKMLNMFTLPNEPENIDDYIFTTITNDKQYTLYLVS